MDQPPLQRIRRALAGACLLHLTGLDALPQVPLEHVQLANLSVWQGRETALTSQPFFVLADRVDRVTISNALQAMQELEFDDHNDEADWQPAYEVYIMEQGTPLPGVSPQPLQDAVRELERQVLPFVREAYKCKECFPCTAFVRRYLKDERLFIPAHFDVTAFSTIILPLSPAANYTGGFFVQPTAHVNSRAYVHLDVGDVAVHDFTLNHGIDVKEGGRFSLVVWVSETRAACRGSSTPWHADRALRGDVVAQHILGMMYGQGNGAPQDDARALEWTLMAARGGLANAQFSAGTMYIEGRGTATNETAAHYWYSKAAAQGDASAQMIMARMYSEGIGIERDEFQARRWYELSREQTGVPLMGPPKWSR